VKWAGCWVLGRAGKKRKRQAGLGGLERGLGEDWSVLFFFQFLFFYFLFKLLLKTFSKCLNKLLTTQSIKTHAFNMMHKTWFL
jgi:hypothetical protein